MPTFLQCADTLASDSEGDVVYLRVLGELRHSCFPHFSILYTIAEDHLGGWGSFII